MPEEKKRNPAQPSIDFLRRQKKRLEEKKGQLSREIAVIDAEIEKFTNAINALK